MTTTADTTTPESNTTFARRVKCNHTTASRLRSGQRMPSGQMLLRICNAYDLDKSEALDVFGQGPEAFSCWLRDRVFSGRSTDDEVPPQPSANT